MRCRAEAAQAPPSGLPNFLFSHWPGVDRERQACGGDTTPIAKKRLALGPSESQSKSGSARDVSRWEQPAVSYRLTE